MIVERKQGVDSMALWRWLLQHLPPSLKAQRVPSGYGYRFYIYHHTHVRGGDG